MTVQELIQQLLQYSDDTEVCFELIYICTGETLPVIEVRPNEDGDKLILVV